jgi:2'-5' RNA ligase
VARSVWFVGAPVALVDERELPPLPGEVRWTSVADRHLTLRYLGRVDDDIAMSAWRAMPALDLPPTASVLRWARFGRSALALVLDDPDGRLAAAAATAHPDAPPPYRPHVTLGRIPRRERPPSPTAIARWPLPADVMRVGAPTLFRTRPPGDGDRYEPVVERPARATGG